MNKLIANERAYKTLAASLRGGRLSQALLIEGPAGCGKYTFAREIAQAALCSEKLDGLPCGTCRDCMKVEKGVHPDVLTYESEGKSFRVETVRALRREAYVRPGEAAGKVLILRNTQEMTSQAQNALLKIMEEPPANVTFLLTCDNRFHLLETIRSRVQMLALEVPSVRLCAEYVRTRLPEVEAGAAEQAAEKARGSIGRALALLEGDGESLRSDLLRAPELLYDACLGDELAALTAFARYERDRAALAELLEQMRVCLTEALLRTPQEGRMQTLVTRAGRLRLFEIIDIIEDTAHAARQNAGVPLLVTSLCARIRSALAS